MGKNKKKSDKDQITGLKIDVLYPNGVKHRFRDGVVYMVEYDYDAEDVNILRSLSKIPTKAPPAGKTYLQVQLSKKGLMKTEIYSDGDVTRAFHKGKIKFNKKGNLKVIKNRKSGYMTWESDYDAFYGSAEVYSPSHKIVPKKKKGGFFDLPRGKEVAHLSMTGHDLHLTSDGSPKYWTTSERGAGFSYFYNNLGGGRYFFEGWHLEPFDTSLI
ncbi:hypothetical protein SynRS9907_01353 [Synechococcus sp. RS9907]|uniref:hypothetical protein n=1 Tax=Synechococcus sp. RS9907 TaxID=221350 RepID=UPI00165DAEB9|nr:hypothetical protein [Synechococcus sp. RS9907]QNI82197.1 hypothetical protein SynRS9907_01353 [Synechococcus sp. RS9907]